MYELLLLNVLTDVTFIICYNNFPYSLYVDNNGLRDLQHQLSHASTALNVYSRCIKTVKDILANIIHSQQHGSEEMEQEEEEVRVSGQEKRTNLLLVKCLKLLDACETQGSKGETEELDQLLSGAIVSSSRGAVSSLYSEVEECQKNLQRDRLAFEEKLEEIAELKSACQTLLEEKERVEALWMASQNSEAKMADQVQQLERKVALLEEEKTNMSEEECKLAYVEEVSETGGGGRNLEEDASAYGVVCGEEGKEMDEEMDVDRTSLLMEDSLEEEDEDGRSEADRDMLSSVDFRRIELLKFKATRSLLLGRVQARRLSVSDRVRHTHSCTIYSSRYTCLSHAHKRSYMRAHILMTHSNAYVPVTCILHAGV